VTAKFKAPTDAQVKEVLRRIPTPQLRRAFFEGLKNPLWVEPLAAEGVFRNPPEPEPAEDGLFRDVYWPEIEYLIRMAPAVPEAVVNVLKKIEKSNNAWVRRGAVEIGAVIPADAAARLGESLVKAWESTGLGWRTDPRSLVDFAVNLIQGGQIDIGMRMADLIFKLRRSKDDRKPTAQIGAYWYEIGISKLAAAAGGGTLAAVLRWLISYERDSDKFKKGVDFTFFSRESIRKRDYDYEDIEQALIDAVRDLAIKAMLDDVGAAMAALLGSGMLLGRKIALFSVGEAIRRVDSGDQHLETLLSAASELLFDERSTHYSCRIDYAELARAVANVSPETISPLQDFFDRLGERAGRGVVERSETGNDLHEDADRWNHIWLAAIGVEALPAKLRITLADLDSKYGVIEAPLETTPIVTEWRGPNSPLNLDEMAAMSGVELVAHLESWHDLGDGWGPEPSHEGQGRELTSLLTTNPKAVAGVSDLTDRLRPTYLRAILSGWEAALKSDVEPDWVQVAEVLTGVLEHADVSKFPPEGGHGDDDSDFLYAKQAAVSLLEQLVKPNSTLVIPEQSLLRFAELMVDSVSDVSAWEQYIEQAGGGGMDAFTTSLNWRWPIGIRGLIYLMTHGKDTIWYGAARSALETELARLDMPGASRAVVGEGLGRLITVDAAWLELRVPDLFGSETGLSSQQQIALTTAITVHHYHPVIYDLLTSSMIGAIRSKSPITAGWRTEIDPLQRIGDWVINAIIRGHSTVEDSIAHEFFSVVPPKIRGNALGYVGWALMHAQTVDDPIRDRLATLWDLRVAHVHAHPEDVEELIGFCWFVKSHKFDVEWWLPRLKEALELCPQLSSESHLIGEEIASAADADPRAALEVLKLLLEGRDETGMVSFELTRTAAPVVIARAKESGDEGLKQEAVAYMNELGEKGNRSLELEVNRHLSG
jgi:hypothetical protein